MQDQLDLVAIRCNTERHRAHVDTNGERFFSEEELRKLAALLLDAAANIGDTCPLVPFHDQIIVQIIEFENRQSAGGVAIPDTAIEGAALRGVVLAIGPLVRETPWWALWVRPDKRITRAPRVDDLISFSPHAGTVTKVGDRRYLTMKAVYALTQIVVTEHDVKNAVQRPEQAA